MKQLLISTLFVLMSMFGFAQNGGQSNENNVLKITYQGWYSGVHKVLLQNKLNCSITVQYKFENTTQTVTIPALSTITLTKTAPSNSILEAKAKRSSGANCISSPDNGWVEVKTCFNGLPIKFKSVTGKRIDSKTVQLTIDVEEDNTIEYYNIKTSFDGGKTFKIYTILFPNGVEGNKIYTVNIKL